MSDLRVVTGDKIVTCGSCFAENIAKQLTDAGFSVDINPFGMVYNPSSLAKSFTELLDEKKYTAGELFQYENLYHSFAHNSRFSDRTPDAVLDKINTRLQYSSAFLRDANILIITFGTAYVYRLREIGEVVSNCHKLPENRFIRNRLSADDILKEWNPLLNRLKDENKSLNIIFTVSPIRHFRDGFHENQLSKSVLLLATDELIKGHSGFCHYFPAYEILLDDLRDYRFYDDDLLHPSNKAVDYILEKFSEMFFDKTTVLTVSEFKKTQKTLRHKPLIV
jgi:hypothetical protein